MIVAMKNSPRMAVAVLMTALVIGGIAVAGLSLRSHPAQIASPSPLVRERVVHETRVRTVHVHPRKATSASASPPPAPAVTTVRSTASQQPPQAAPPQEVSSRVSPVGGRGEHERGEHEGPDD
jgi:hypothetical protein